MLFCALCTHTVCDQGLQADGWRRRKGATAQLVCSTVSVFCVVVMTVDYAQGHEAVLRRRGIDLGIDTI